MLLNVISRYPRDDCRFCHRTGLCEQDLFRRSAHVREGRKVTPAYPGAEILV